MRAAKKITLDSQILQELVPLNALSPERFKELSEKIIVEEVKSGRYLFRKGDRDNQSIYLLEGKINLIDRFRKVASEVVSGTDMSRYPVSNMQPRTVSARAAKKSIIARIDSSLLDAFLTWDQSNSEEAVEIGADENSDWMTRMLQSEAFRKIPPSTIQSLLMKMQSVEVQAGETIVRQGDDGEYFYTIREGRCAVTRRDGDDGDKQHLAELAEGDSFGGEALVSETKRSATVSMLTDGILMRVTKEEFVSLLVDPLVKRVSYEDAAAMVNAGAVWVDVRTEDEYESESFEDSVNIPLANLHAEIPELVFNAKYVLCCDTGRRSASAAFLLNHKGFDAYVLEGGISSLDGGISGVEARALDQEGLPARSSPAADEYSPETNSQTAAVIDFVDVQYEVDTLPPAGPEFVAETEIDEATTELEAEIEALRTLNETLVADLKQSGSTEARLTEQLELLRSELGESGEKLASLYTQARADTDEKQRLEEENARLQENNARQLQSLQSELDETRQQLAGLQSGEDASSEQRQQLLDESEARQQASQAEVSQLQEELAGARSRLQTFEEELAAASEAGESRQSEHEDTINGLRAELQERITLSDRLGEELAAMQQQFSEVTGTLAAAIARSEELETGNTAQAASVETLQQELDDSRRQMEQQAATAEENRQALERRIEEISTDHEHGSERLSGVSADHEKAALRIQSLEQELEQLSAAQREADGQLQAQVERADNMDAGRQAAEEALGQLRADQDAERARHDEEAGALRQTIEELRSEQGQVHELAAADKTILEEQLRQLESEKSTQLEQYEVRLQELQEGQSRQESELQELREERDEWKQKSRVQVEENDRLQQDVARLNEQIAAHSDSTDEQMQALQAALDTGQLRIAELEQAVVANDAQLADVQEGLADKEAAVSEGERQLDALKHELAEHDERARRVEQENEESIRKAHEDLTRKNDNEKELQGQIVRLRKKLEQATLEQQQVRESVQGDLDHIREELHGERQARAEERAEMAARQRELKEQLIAVASEHESNMSNQSGAIEEARDAARNEERVRLQDLLQTQQHMEEQLQNMQQELQQAHAELARQHREEKDRRQAGSDLLQEQKTEAKATIRQLEASLKLLTQERDHSLEEQQALREKLNVLRGEVEVARGLMNVTGQEQIEDPVQLRNELEESRKNVEVSVRLRTEAEAARDQVIRERDALRQLLESRDDVELPLHVPSLDEGEAGASHAGPSLLEDLQTSPDTAGVSIDEAQAASSEVDVSHKRNWSGMLIGGVTVAITALVFWLMLGTGQGLQRSGSDMNADMDQPVLQDAVPDVATATTLPEPAGETPQVVPASPEPIEETSRAVPVLPVDPVAGEWAAPVVQPAPVVVDSAPVTGQAVTQPETSGAPVAPGPVIEKPDVPEPEAAPAPVLTAGPVFRDKLKNGRKGPQMITLPGASYLMGSPGNSLNFDEGPRHKVTLKAFSIGMHEVSFAEYDRFARATRRRLPPDEGWGRGDRPVINISWHDASAYAAWLSKQTGKSYRLPTESEWEYAIRAGSTSQRWWGNNADTVPANCFNCGSEWDGYRTAPVGSFAANNFGLHDMAGNVQEWAQDCYLAGYADAPVDGSARLIPECTQRAVRGGAYTSPQDTLRSAKRGQYDQETRLDNLGFRVVRDN